MAALGTGGGKESTEWEDILKEKGVIPEKTEEELVEEALSSMIEETVARYDPHERKTVDELDEDLEEADSEEERILVKHRDRRMAEMKENMARKRYGPGVRHISAHEWKEEVTQAGPEVYVVVQLFQEGLDKSKLMDSITTDLSVKFKHTKFVKCKATDAIKKYPDSKLPTLLVYHNGSVLKQFVGFEAFNGLKTDADDVEWALGKVGAVETDMEEAPTKNFTMRRA
eukprot:Plantae.Rhodophyta-Purpureofilum_apyrenoidigerum.ctg5822.p1 GENE.Plantae.Rhodophyta-Purpureofilum_apyrenoidigerum.ctg5822~~Plantae.Rhodophyta-Purpureofilum_apyrenoidigerum.ctg5822.p1  ORF type:complete len:227 (-),score=65.18 Plantae.Rhodophyta-Purpureofilum_apyrenoidigerum.ctg5822:305-985(-)